jgi:hypothetical protein
MCSMTDTEVIFGTLLIFAFGVGASIQTWIAARNGMLWFGKGLQGSIPSISRQQTPFQFWLLLMIQIMCCALALLSSMWILISLLI